MPFFNMSPLIRANSLLVCCLLVFGSLSAQDFYRYKSDFTIKEKESGQEKGMLITGQVFYDKNSGKILYDIRFPEPEQWFLLDTTMFRIVADTVKSRQGIAPLSEYSFFNLILNQQLSDFGLAKNGYKPGEVRQEGKQVLATWNPPAQFADKLGPIILAQENKRLAGVVFQDKDKNILGKFYLQDYQNIDGLPVPGKIYQIYYREKNEFIRIIQFKNILINSTDEANMYDFRLPGSH